ncbi:MAG: hypothetical protein OEW25_01000 [Nitrospira sp.]|nr:hypothetical protein [Nitrospira sp.]MDH5251875.1 hypothetical protein [Nitrospira sp.]
MLNVDRDKPRHYGDEQGRYWSVSQVCDVVSGGCDYYAPGSAERGQDLHVIFALAVGHYAGLCEAPDVPEIYTGYHQAMHEFIAWAKPVPSAIERTMRHKTYPYAGTPDFIGSIGDEFGVLDLKTGTPAKWHSLQIHAYQKMTDKAARMWLLYIKDDGTFQFKLVKPSARDWAAFQNGLSILQWRED